MSSIGARIKRFRNQKGHTQVNLAKNACISRSYLADVEANRYNPSLATLMNLAQALGIAVSCLLDDRETNLPDDIVFGNKAISITETSSNAVEPIEPNNVPTKIAAHFEHSDFTEEETAEINNFIDFIAAKRAKKQL